MSNSCRQKRTKASSNGHFYMYKRKMRFEALWDKGKATKRPLESTSAQHKHRGTNNDRSKGGAGLIQPCTEWRRKTELREMGPTVWLKVPSCQLCFAFHPPNNLIRPTYGNRCPRVFSQGKPPTTWVNPIRVNGHRSSGGKTVTTAVTRTDYVSGQAVGRPSANAQSVFI